jgi:site-specific recombinase XerD
LKHTYATTLVAAGANVKDVQELLGHSDIKFTLNTYSHVTRQTRKKAVGIFENTIHGMG